MTIKKLTWQNCRLLEDKTKFKNLNNQLLFINCHYDIAYWSPTKKKKNYYYILEITSSDRFKSYLTKELKDFKVLYQ